MKHDHEVTVKDIQKLSPTQVRIQVEIGEETVRAHEKSTTQRYAQQAKIPGFRPGRAPVGLVEKKFGDDIRKDVVSHLVEHGFLAATQKADVEPLGLPSIQIAQPVIPGKPLVFTAEFEVHPKIELKLYKGAPLKTPLLEVQDSEIDAILGNLRDRFSTLEPTEATTLEKNHFAVADIAYELVGEPARKGEAKPFTVEVGVEGLLPGLEEGLMQMKVGERKTIPAKFPTDYAEKDLAGRDVNFDVLLQEIKKKVLPDLDDSLANRYREGTTLTALRDEVRKSLADTKAEELRESQRKSVMEFLLSNNPVDAPRSLVSHQAKFLLSRIEEERKNQKIDEPLKLTEADQRELNARAERFVKSSLLLREVADKENIQLSEAAVESRIAEMSGRLGRTPEEMRKFLVGKGMISKLEDELLTDQVFDFLIQNAKYQ